MVCQKPYVIEMDGQVKTLLSLTGIGTWSKKVQKHPYVIKEQPRIEILKSFIHAYHCNLVDGANVILANISL